MISAVDTVVYLLQLQFHVLKPVENRQRLVIERSGGILAGKLLHYADLAAAGNVHLPLVRDMLPAKQAE